MRRPADLPPRYGGRFFTEGVPESKFPEAGMSAPVARRVMRGPGY